MGLREELANAQTEADPRVAELRQALERTQRQLFQAKERTDRLVQVTHDAASDAVLAMGMFDRVPQPPRDRRKSRAEHALWHMTDWQGAKRTASYDSAIMRELVMRFAEKAVKVTNIQRADHPVKDATLMFGGDMVEGLFNFPTQPFEIDATIFEQYVTVGMLLVDVVRHALANYEKVTVVAEWGNHGRIGSKRDSVPKADNFDRMTYELARRLLGNEPRLTWQDCPEDIQRVQIGNYRALLMHGDEVGRSGFASPSAWQAAGNRWKSGAYGWQFQDIFLGHYHRHAQEPLADGLGAIYWTGSTESDNRYARDSLAASGVPSQRLHFVDAERGRTTAAYQIWLDA